MAIHGLAQSEMWQEDAWKLLCEKVYEKDFDYEIVKSTPWSVTSFTTLSGNEHIGQKQLNQLAVELFFKGKLLLSYNLSRQDQPL